MAQPTQHEPPVAERAPRPSHLERQNRILTAELVKALKQSQALNAKLANGLDRVLAAKFDAPLMPNPTAQPANEAMFPEDLSDVMSTESDTDFLERTTP